MTSRVYVVPEISCGHCKETIEGELAGLEGVESAEVDIPAKTVTVVGNVTDDKVRDALSEVGYDVADAH